MKKFYLHFLSGFMLSFFFSQFSYAKFYIEPGPKGSASYDGYRNGEYNINCRLFFEGGGGEHTELSDQYFAISSRGQPGSEFDFSQINDFLHLYLNEKPRYTNNSYLVLKIRCRNGAVKTYPMWMGDFINRIKGGENYPIIAPNACG